jgi:hypothetical protein
MQRKGESAQTDEEAGLDMKVDFATYVEQTRHQGKSAPSRSNVKPQLPPPELETRRGTTKSRGRGRSHASVTRRMQHIQPLKSGHDDNMIRDPVRESALDRGRKSEYRIDARAG